MSLATDIKMANASTSHLHESIPWPWYYRKRYVFGEVLNKFALSHSDKLCDAESVGNVMLTDGHLGWMLAVYAGHSSILVALDFCR